ncbi:hypothetical protein ZEAMMB73_Zm00001d006727 [Zea mays]|uniref:Uncharacterized protein n=1 Tax=Zea mays TaxID=4577 RepID=A0A1D6EZV8_MAIZE|nr:hypothetical protein ZEAMMB73_Zm00001d006727 [Zea mays]ONM24865.1 hypothetical protein ZEAMMB73_Zm00001d006727 [Zea mays]
MCSHDATAALNCSPTTLEPQSTPPHRTLPSTAVAAIQASPTAPDRSARPRLLLAAPSSSSFPCHHLFPSHDVPPGFTSANEPRLHRRLLGPAGSRSPTRSHPLRTLSSSSFAAAGTSFEKRSIDLVDHGRYGAAHPRAPGMATRSAAASKREGRRSQQQLDPVGDEERAGADDRCSRSHHPPSSRSAFAHSWVGAAMAVPRAPTQSAAHTIGADGQTQSVLKAIRADGQTQLSHEIALELSQRSAAAGLSGLHATGCPEGLLEDY